MNPVQYGAKLAYDAHLMKDISGEDKYKKIYEEHPDFVKTFPLVTKYFCLYDTFHEGFFQELNNKREMERANLERSIILQADYVKKLLVYNGVSKATAKKMSNIEMSGAQSQLNQIKKETEKLKKQYENEKKDSIRDLRKEFKEFVIGLPSSSADD